MIKNLMQQAVNEGCKLHVSYEGECDYVGTKVADAFSALNACDEMELRIIKDGQVIGWALYIGELEADEQIADYGGAWFNEKLGG